MDVDLALKIVRNAHREHFLETIRVLEREIQDYDVVSRIGVKLAEQQLQREVSTIVDTH